MGAALIVRDLYRISRDPWTALLRVFVSYSASRASAAALPSAAARAADPAGPGLEPRTGGDHRRTRRVPHRLLPGDGQGGSLSRRAGTRTTWSRSTARTRHGHGVKDAPRRRGHRRLSRTRQRVAEPLQRRAPAPDPERPGLNPVAGEGDGAHQGRRAIPGAVGPPRAGRRRPPASPLLREWSRRAGDGPAEPWASPCNASTTSAPGGWPPAQRPSIAAGPHGAPAWYIKTLFQRRGTVESMWRRNPAFHDHVLDFDSVRSLAPACSSIRIGRRRASTGRSFSAPRRDDGRGALGGTAREPWGRGGRGHVVAPAWASPVDLDLADPVVAGSTAALTLSVAAGGTAALPAWAHDRCALGSHPGRCRSCGTGRHGRRSRRGASGRPRGRPRRAVGCSGGSRPRGVIDASGCRRRDAFGHPQPHRHLRPPPQPHRRPRSVTRRRRGPCRPPRRPRPSLPRSTSSRPRPPARSS